jgi:hypothetical protein
LRGEGRTETLAKHPHQSTLLDQAGNTSTPQFGDLGFWSWGILLGFAGHDKGLLFGGSARADFPRRPGQPREANSPGSFATKTVNLMADLGKADAEIFRDLSRFAWQSREAFHPLIFNVDSPLCQENGINLENLLALEARPETPRFSPV